MASCATEHAPRLLYEAVVEELREYLEASSPALREATAERARKAFKCDRFSDFVDIFPRTCRRIRASARVTS